MNSVNAGNNRFCGPAALSIITGMTTDEAESAILDIRRNTRKGSRVKVTGSWMSELVEVLSRLGYTHTYLTHLDGCTIFHLLNVLDRTGFYIIATATHFVTIHKGPAKYELCDNHTKKPISIASSARLMQRVVQVVFVEKL